MSVIEYASHMGHKPTVGGIAEHSQFAKDITAYVDSVRKASGLSVRGVSALTNGVRGNSWWADIFNGKNILTTNDVHYIATSMMGISPYELVSEARRLATGGLVTVRTFTNVGGMSDDGYEQQATEQQSIPERKAAKRGTLKARNAFEGNDEGSTDTGGESGS